jgi:hypothetical protein
MGILEACEAMGGGLTSCKPKFMLGTDGVATFESVGLSGLSRILKVMGIPSSPHRFAGFQYHFGLHDVKFVPKGYFSPPGFYPTQNIQQVATAISMSPNETGKKIHIVNFVNWSKEGRDCTADLISRCPLSACGLTARAVLRALR